MDNTLIVSVIVGYFAVLIGIMYYTSRGATNDTFFLGERKSPWYLVAFGMIGASLSGVTFISVPGGVAKGGFGYMQVVFGYLIGYFIVAYVLLPIYYKMNLTSIYEYLKDRFGYWSYKTGAGLFLVSRVMGASIRLLLVAEVLQIILLRDWGIPFEVTVVISIALIWVYTNKGGIKTIIWTDTLQTAFMLLAVGITVWIIGDQLHLGDKGGIVSAISSTDMATMFHFENPLGGGYFWKSFIGGIFITVGMTGLDQDMMQKNLSCKNAKESQKNMISMAVVLVLVNLVFLALGALMFMYNTETGIGDQVLAEGRTDLLFSQIAMNPATGTFVGILFLLGLIAAAYSSADSALTSLTTSVSIDFLEIEKKEEEQQVRIRKWVHVIMSMVLILVVIILHYTTKTDAIWLLIKLAGFTYGPLIALFFFGILTKRALRDKLVMPVCLVSATVMAFIWMLSKGGELVAKDQPGLLGDYVFGADLIIWNALLAFVLLFAISTKSVSKNKSEVLDSKVA
ncbi:MAG: SSS family transporter [Flavobacteriales bacterium]|jgi:SSS family transporter